MRIIIILSTILVLISCSSKNKKPAIKEFIHYTNTEILTKSNSIFKYYLIENAPKDNFELRMLTDKYSDSLMIYKLNDSLENIVILYFTDKESNWTRIDERYLSDGPTVEDYYNPRRAEYVYRLDKNKNIWLKKTIYENKSKVIIPPVVFSDKNKIKLID